MKRKNTDIYADIHEDSVQQNEQMSEKSFQIQGQEHASQTSEERQNRSDELQKKDAKAKVNEYKLNNNQIRYKFSSMLNSEQLVDEVVAKDKAISKSNNQSGYDTSRSAQPKKQVNEILRTKSSGKSSFLQQFDEQIEQKKNGSHTLYGVLQPAGNKEVTEQKTKPSTTGLLPSSSLQSQRINPVADAKKIKLLLGEGKSQSESKHNDFMISTRNTLNGIFLSSKFTALQTYQSSSSQSKRISTQQSKSQLDFVRGQTSNGIKPTSKLPLFHYPFNQQTPSNTSKRIKTTEDTSIKSEGGQSLFFSTSRQNTTQQNSSIFNNINNNNPKFKKIQIVEKLTKNNSIDTKNNTLTDFRCVSYLNQKSKDSESAMLRQSIHFQKKQLVKLFHFQQQLDFNSNQGF